MAKLLRPAVGVMRGCSQVRSGSSGSLDTWHHGPDSASMPAVNQEAVTLVNMRFCPYAQRTALCLNAKNIQYDIINSQLKNKPSWLWDLNPIGKVPVLIHDGNTIYESLVTCEYIEVRVTFVMVHCPPFCVAGISLLIWTFDVVAHVSLLFQLCFVLYRKS